MIKEVQTARLTLVLQTPAETRSFIAGMTAEEKTELSADWLERVYASTSADPWIHGFVVISRDDGAVVGRCGFKGPPGDEEAVEIAYGVAPENEGKGYATEMAEALTTYAFDSGQVRLVCAHTLPGPNASTRVLTKCGFRNVGEVVDPDDGLVWRWEKRTASA